jgi:hypothetical protein
MKKLLVIAFLLGAVSTFAQSPVKFTETKHNFGKLKQGVPASYIFKFTNTGSKPLVIESAVAGCGCTTPEYPKQPIAKGKQGTIKVTYNAANPGAFTKDVTVKFVNVEQPIVLNITGEVVAEKPAEKPKS